MKDIECTEFLKWCLPQLRLRWPGFRKVRRQVCKRLNRRISELGLSDLFAYRGYLDGHSEEWKILDSCAGLLFPASIATGEFSTLYVQEFFRHWQRARQKPGQMRFAAGVQAAVRVRRHTPCRYSGRYV